MDDVIAETELGYLLYAGFLLSLFFDHENGGNIFLRSIH
jgi:hypothetical protein